MEPVLGAAPRCHLDRCRDLMPISAMFGAQGHRGASAAHNLWSELGAEHELNPLQHNFSNFLHVVLDARLLQQLP